MKKEKLKELTIEQLQKKKKDLTTFSGIFIVLILALSFFAIRTYLQEPELEWTSIAIIVCTIGGFFTVYEELKQVRGELKDRDESH